MQETSNEIISIIVVTCGVNDYINSCLESIRRQSYAQLEVIVIDNSLNGDFSQRIKKAYPEIKLYSEVKNLYYSGAINKGIRQSRGDFVLCLNDDVVLDEDFIYQALRGFKQDASVGTVSGKILRQDRTIIDSAGLFLSFFRTAQERGYNKQDKGQYDCPGYIFGANGAAALYRRKMLEDVRIGSDYLDSEFRMFFEDLDIAWRARNLGWKAYYIPQAVAYHLRGGTARRRSGINKPCARRFINDELYLDLVKNRHLSIIKNESIVGFLLYSPFILFYDLISYTYLLFFRPYLLKKTFTNLKFFKSALRKRNLINKRSK